jgi:hypothetical protein
MEAKVANTAPLIKKNFRATGRKFLQNPKNVLKNVEKKSKVFLKKPVLFLRMMSDNGYIK